MNRQRERREETRARMLEAAGRGFRAHGFAGIGVDGVAQAAGVTSGAFYAHFGSKNAAFDSALVAGLDEVIEAVPKFQNEHGTGWIKAFARYYLGKPHRTDLAGGCAMTGLSLDVVRAGPETHAVYEAKMTKIATLMANGLEDGSTDDRYARAWAVLSVLIGGLTIARAVKSSRVAEEIAAAVREAAVRTAGNIRGRPLDGSKDTVDK